MAIAAAAALVTVAARVSVPIPGSPVPQSLQTLAVVLAGAWLGPVRGTAAIILYIVCGAVGLPVFADGASGPQHLVGPTAGYLAGFVAAAGFVGWWCRSSWGRGWLGVTAAMVAGHLVILFLGWLRLSVLVGPADAWGQGVGPFLWGGAMKALVGAGLVDAARRAGWVGEWGVAGRAAEDAR